MSMYFNKMSVISLSTALVLAVSGCSGGGGSDDVATVVAPLYSGSAGLSGTLGNTGGSANGAPSRLATRLTTSPSVDPDASAQLIVDLNKNGTFGDSKDITYNSQVIDGSFNFSGIKIEEEGITEAQLTVLKRGFAPVVKILTLSDGQTLSIITEAGTTPVQTEVVALDRSDSNVSLKGAFLKMGLKTTSFGVQSYSKIMSLSQLRAEAEDPGSSAGEISTSIIPIGAIPDSVTEIRADMRAFDPTSAEDSKFFPGEYKGVGKSSDAKATDEERQLVSVGFDLVSLTDQNGEPIVLDTSAVKPSKLRPQAIDFDSCLQTKVRYLSDAQVALIVDMGDDDLSTVDIFEIPMWYYSYESGMWQYLGEAEYTNAATSPSGRAYATMCITENWGQYLNLDYDFAIEQPKNICIKAIDQDGEAISNLNISAHQDTSYSQAYLDSNGEAKLGLTLGNDLSNYEFSYSGVLTRWINVSIDESNIVENDPKVGDCDYNLSIVLQNPYTTTLEVNATNIDGSADTNGYVYVQNSGGNYFYEYAYLDENGQATFKIAPDVDYVVYYNAQTATVNANGTKDNDESSDTTTNVAVSIVEENQAPDVYAYFYNPVISDKATQARFYVSASDPNGDAVTLDSLTFNGVALVKGTHYEITQQYTGSSYDSFYAILNLEHEDINGSVSISATSLVAGTTPYSLVARYSDTSLNSSASASLSVESNRAPVINGIYLYSATGSYVNINSEVLPGLYTVSAYAYDPNGDDIVKTYKLNNGDFNESNRVNLDNNATYTITVKAEEVGDNPLSKEESFTVVVGDRSPAVELFTAEVDDNNNINGNLLQSSVDPVSVSVVGDTPAGLTLYFTGAYSFDGRAHNDLGDGETREVVANLRVTNRYGTADTNLTVTVTGTNDAPTLTIAPSVMTTATGVEVPFTASDVDGTVSVSATAVNGSVMVGDENLTYTPNPGALSDTITVTATDGDLNVTRTVTVFFGNQPPSLGFHNYFEVDGGASISGQIDFSDDGEIPATVAIAQDAVPGLTINADGTLTYSAAAFAELAQDAMEEIYVNVRVTDSEGLETVGEIFIMVHGVYTPPLADGGFTQGMSIYGIEQDEESGANAWLTILDAEGVLNETEWTLDLNSGEFVLDSDTGGEDDELFLNDGVWIQGWNDNTYELINGNLRLGNGAMVSILRTIDLVNPSVIDALAIEALSAEIPGSPTIEFTAGAEAYVIGFKTSEMYVLHNQPTLQVQNETGEWTSTETPFSTILEYMGSVNSPAGSYSVTGEWSGIDFKRSISGEATYFHAYPVVDSTGEIISSLVAGMSGGLVTVDHSAIPITQQDVGTWSVVTLPDSAGLAIELTLTTGESNYFSNLIAVANSTVYQGVHMPASTEFVVDEEDVVGLNSIAFNDIKDAIRDYINAGGDASLAERTYWSEIDGTPGTLEKHVFNVSATEATWTEIVNPGGPLLCTGTVSLVFETNSTVTVQALTDSCGLEVPNNSFNIPIEMSGVWNYMLVDGNRWYFNEADARADFLGGTTPPPSATADEAVLEIRSLSINNWDPDDSMNEWFWNEYMLDENGSYVEDPSSGRPDNANYNADLTITLNDTTAVKYLGLLDISTFNTEFGSTFSSAVEVHRVAYIRLADEVETWEDAQDPSTNSPFTSLESVLSAYSGANGMVYEQSGFSNGEGLAFGAEGVLIIVNANGETINANAGTYEIVAGTATDNFTRALKTRPTYAGYNKIYHTVFTEEGAAAVTVRRGDWSAADTGGIAYFFNEAGKNEFVTYFNANKESMTTDFEFHQDKITGWVADWNALTAQDASILDGRTLFEFSVEMEQAQTTSFSSVAYFSGTKYFVNVDGLTGYRTYDANNLDYTGEVDGTSVSGGFAVSASEPNSMQIIKNAGASNQQILAFTYSEMLPSDGVAFDLSINGGTSFETYMYNTQAARDAKATSLGF